MKTTFRSTILVILFSYSIISQPQIYNNFKPSSLITSVLLDENFQLQVALQQIMQQYREGFIYYENIWKQNYEFVKSQNEFYIYIYNDINDKKSLIDKVKLIGLQNASGKKSFILEEQEYKRVISNEKFDQLKWNTGINGAGFIVETNGILLDREILHFSDTYNYGKILDREFCLENLKYAETEHPSPLFQNCVDGLLIPYTSNTNEQTGKLLFVDKGWGTIKYGEKDRLTSGAKTYGSFGHGINNLSVPTGLAVGLQ